MKNERSRCVNFDSHNNRDCGVEGQMTLKCFFCNTTKTDGDKLEKMYSIVNNCSLIVVFMFVAWFWGEDD